MFFIKFFGFILAASFVAGAGVLLFYVSVLEKELEEEQVKTADSPGER